MGNNLDYLLGQALSLIFYIITLVVYNRARKEYIGGKIAAAIKLVMGFLCIRLLADFMDYFSAMLLPINANTVLIIKIVLNLSAMCVLFFGGLRFFVTRPAAGASKAKTDPSPENLKPDEVDAEASPVENRGGSTIVLDEIPDEPGQPDHDRPTLGRYEILGQIGKGAMGVVYKGLDSKLQRLTAIKTIRFGDDFSEDQVDDIKKQFYREAEMVARLSHTNIVAIYDIGEDLDLSYLAMEYLDGRGLDRYTRKGNLLSVEKCIKAMIQVCDALQYAHSQNIVHRDIKPANIMLLKNGVVKVTDFGVARLTTGSQTRTGVVKGTPYYMSPEQAKGEKVTGASDIFSLGVVFYQLLTGRLPFSGENLSAIMYQTMTVDPVSAVKFNPGVDKTIVTILERALEKDKKKRYQTAGKMADDLRKLSRSPGEDREPGIEEIKSHQEADKDPSREIVPEPAKTVSTVRYRTQASPWKGHGDILPDTVPEDTVNVPEKAGWITIIGENIRPRLPVIITFALMIFIFVSAPVLYSRHLNRELALQKAKLASSRMKKKVHAVTPVKILPSEQHPIINGKKIIGRSLVTGDTKEQKKSREHPAMEAGEKKKAKASGAGEEDETQKLQARLAREKGEKRKALARLAAIAEKKRMEKKRLAIIAQQKRIEQENLAEAERQQKALRTLEAKKIEQIISEAKTKLAGRQYAGADDLYRKALAMASTSEFKTSESFEKLKKEIESALQNDDMVYGSKGYVYYKNKWFAPDEHKKQLMADGFVKYGNEFIFYKKFKYRLENLATPEVRTFLRSHFTGKNIHKMQIKMKKYSLTENMLLQSRYAVFFNWEVWTFDEIGNGSCVVEVFYDVEKDEWKTFKAQKR